VISASAVSLGEAENGEIVMMTATACDRIAGQASSFEAAPIVHIVDEDVSARRSLAALVELAGWRVETFASARAFFARPNPIAAGCVVLDASLAVPDGFSVHDAAADDSAEMPTIIMGRCDVPSAVRAIKAGAVEFLTKPIDARALLRAIDEAIALSLASLDEHLYARKLRSNYVSMSQRERQVMALIARGLLNKQVGGELGISEITVKAHRGQVMRKMGARSFAELVQMAGVLGLTRIAPASPLGRLRRYDGIAETIAQ
jgi:FixJ family two-component response regulator